MTTPGSGLEQVGPTWVPEPYGPTNRYLSITGSGSEPGAGG